jgi:hypothetical protein
MLLHIPSVKVWGEDEELSARVQKRNDEYDAMVDRHRERDKYTSRAAQTFNQTTRHKKIKAWPPKMTHQIVQASTWEIFDAYEAANSDKKEASDESAELLQQKVTRSLGGVGIGGGSGASGDVDGGGVPSSGSGATASGSLQSSSIVNSSNLGSQNASRLSHHSDGTATTGTDATGTGAGGVGYSSTGSGSRASSSAAPNRLFMNRLTGPSPFEMLAKSKSFLNSLQMLGMCGMCGVIDCPLCLFCWIASHDCVTALQSKR